MLYDWQVDDLLGDILGLEQVDTSADQDLNDMLLQLSSTVPHNLESTLGMPERVSHPLTSASAPEKSDLVAWQKDRQKKDNHNQSKCYTYMCTNHNWYVLI